jgi:hypothetical protein
MGQRSGSEKNGTMSDEFDMVQGCGAGGGVVDGAALRVGFRGCRTRTGGKGDTSGLAAGTTITPSTAVEPNATSGTAAGAPGVEGSQARNLALSRRPARGPGSQQPQSNSLENERLGTTGAMRIYVFAPQQDATLIGFTSDESGANLPDELGPWHQAELSGVVVIGVRDDPITQAVRRDGYFIV